MARASVANLLMIDGLLGVVALGLLGVDLQLSAKDEAPPPPQTSEAGPEERPTVRPRPTPKRTPKTVRVKGPKPEEVLEEARQALGQGKLGEALEILAQAAEELQQDPVFSQGRRQLEDQVNGRDAVLAVLPQAQLLADRGEVTKVQALLDDLPRDADGELQDRLREELDVAKQRSGAGGGFDVGGFKAGTQEQMGRRCAIKVTGLSLGGVQEIRSAVDLVLSLAENRNLELGQMPVRLRVVVLGPSEEAPEASDDLFVTWLRGKDEPLPQILDRVRLGVAQWAYDAILADGRGLPPAWIRVGLPLVLATTVPQPGRESLPALTPFGASLRRQFLADPPGGDGVALSELFSASEPDPVRAWALSRFACFAGDAIDLRAAQTEILRAANKGNSAKPSLPEGAAAGLSETAWVEYLGRS